MTLALVASLGTRALADTDDGAPFPGPSGEDPGTWTDADQADPGTQQEAVAVDTAGGGDQGLGTTGTPQVVHPGGEEHPQAPGLVAEARPEDTDAQTAQAPRTATAGQPEPSDQDEQHDGPGRCASGGCSTEPPDLGPPTVAETGGGPGRRGLILIRLLLEAVGLRRPPPAPAAAEPPQPPPEPPQASPRPVRRTEMEIALDIRGVEEGLHESERRVRSPDEIGDALDRSRRAIDELQNQLFRPDRRIPFADVIALQQRAASAIDKLMEEYAANENPSIVNLVAWNVHAAGEYLRRAASDDERPAREHWNRLALLRLDGADRAIRELTFQVTDTEDAVKLLELATRAAALRRTISGPGGSAMSTARLDTGIPGQPADTDRRAVRATPGFSTVLKVFLPTGFAGNDTRGAATVTPGFDVTGRLNLGIPPREATEAGPVWQGLLLTGAVGAVVVYAVMSGLCGTMCFTTTGPVAPRGLLPHRPTSG
ncbi:MAG TPA: hypothetical protein VKG45_02995 [Actinomycetes bacterium]|nr:hypothetical protein [Actinomycetes bacterium]